jgi:hypothetical protein
MEHQREKRRAVLQFSPMQHAFQSRALEGPHGHGASKAAAVEGVQSVGPGAAGASGVGHSQIGLSVSHASSSAMVSGYTSKNLLAQWCAAARGFFCVISFICSWQVIDAHITSPSLSTIQPGSSRSPPNGYHTLPVLSLSSLRLPNAPLGSLCHTTRWSHHDGPTESDRY